MRQALFIRAAAFLLLGSSCAAAAAPQRYDPAVTFAPLTLPNPPGQTRSANGLPGPAYWTNRADYQIHATLDPAAKTLTGTATIRYTNNSPDTLDVLWIQLEQNLYKTGSRGYLGNGIEPLGTTGGMVVESVAVEDRGRSVSASTLVADTRMQVRLPQPLGPGGKSVTVTIRYHYLIPAGWGGRTSWGPSRHGDIFDMAQWYPRMAVYDDLRGWDTLPYLDQEFYLDYGDFDYWITVPSSMIVAGTGALQNPQEVLTATERQRLAAAATSDRTLPVIAPDEIGRPDTRPKAGGTLTWHYRMENTRDIAWSASSAFAWDAARINLPGGKTALAMSAYPAESAGPQAWSRSTEYLKDAVENFSRRWYPFPYPVAWSIAGPTSGMEYPGAAFDGIDDRGKDLFWITAHEIGHTWFPMVVGFNERRDAWMDEGFNTFIDTYESDDFNRGEFAPKRDSEFAPGGGNPVDEILPILADPDAPVILSRADTVTETYRHPVTYFKSALGLKLLREQILGPDRFDPAFRRFIAAWAYKHPTPSDFFRAMESEAGEDLSWWWRGWYFNNWTLDLAVTKVAAVGNDPAKGVLVTVENRDPMVMPATLRLDLADGTHRDVRLPAETWIRTRSTPVYVDTHVPVVAVTIDPDHLLPDHDRSNNSLAVAAGGGGTR